MLAERGRRQFSQPRGGVKGEGGPEKEAKKRGEKKSPRTHNTT